MTTLTQPFTILRTSGMPRRAQALQLLVEFAGMVANAAYLVAAFGLSVLNGEAKSVPAIIAVTVLCSAIIVSAHRTELEPALWGIGYIAGFALVAFLGQTYFGDSSFLCTIYTCIVGAFVVVFGGLVPLEGWVQKKYPAKSGF
jgi:hypothetical protein